MKKLFFVFLIAVTLLQANSISRIALAQETKTNPSNYVLLAPLPCENGTSGCEDGLLKTFDASKTHPLGYYLNTMLKIFIGICGVLAIVMIVIGGMEYMASELVSSKESGKSKITGALFGLVLALGSYALLNTIDPNLLNTDPVIKVETIDVKLEDLGGENESVPFQSISKDTLKTLGVTCEGTGGKSSLATIGQQFIGKTIYSQTARNTTSGSTIYADCSSFVAQVYSCAGMASPGGTTAAIFSSGNTNPVKGAEFDFSQLHPGDLIGWKKGDNGSGKKVESSGHVMIYLGGGKVLHSSSTAGGVAISNLDDYKARVTYVKWP